MSDPISVLQDTLAAEHAAVFGYGVLGGRTSASGTPDLYELIGRGFAGHRQRRDTLTEWIRGLGADPVAALPSYQITTDLGTPEQIRTVARQLETAAAAQYAALVGNSVRATRRWAIEALTATALNLVNLGAAPEPFPGLDEYQEN